MRIKKHIKRGAILLSLVGLLAFYFCLPDPLFTVPYSTIIEDNSDHLLGAKISKDGQWRFPAIESVPKAWEDAIITFEDKRFYQHIGVDVLAIGRALVDNIQSGEVVSGASTLSMQVIRLSRQGKPRTMIQKIIEAFMAMRLECRYSKKEILNLYASHAPFGGNVVGLEAATWRYYHKAPQYLSISEAATLAVLPNAPGLIHPGRNRDQLKAKRDRLLLMMLEEGILDEQDLDLAVLEPIPEKTHRLPRMAPHFLEWSKDRTGDRSRIRSTISTEIQADINELARFYHDLYTSDGIENMGIIVLDTKTGNPLGYLGNPSNTDHEYSVDMVQAKRNSGSVLKPLLYAHTLHEGLSLPTTLQADIPIQIQGYRPRNYHRSFEGAVAADQALSKSLNIPAIQGLRSYGVQRFLERLKSHGFTSFTKSADHYGLSLILGGGEVTLYELAKVYAQLGSQLINPSERQILDKGSIYLTFKAMEKVSRPDSEGQWEQFSSSRRLAWKTGTSYGHRDAWAVGVTPEYTIAVWVGNADGEGRHDLVGVKKAAPVLFDLLNRLPNTSWFEIPADDLETAPICSKSGHLPSKHCNSIDTILLPRSYQKTDPCPYHRTVFLDEEEYLANSNCTPTGEMEKATFFILPPTQAYYYQRKDPSYVALPSQNPRCEYNESGLGNQETLAFIYPNEKSDIYLPVDLDGLPEKAIFKATHADPKGVIYWHLDETYLGSTKDGFHTMDITALKGAHEVLIVDQWGNESVQEFNIVR